MCEVCDISINTQQKNQNSFSGLMVMERQYDPTRTLTLRNQFAREMRKRFTNLQREIKEAVVDKDVFGLQESQKLGQPLAQQVQRRQFNFPRSRDKVSAFMEWLEKMQRAEILQIGEGVQLGEAVEDAWTNKYVEDTYKRGVLRARYEMQKAGYPVPSIEESGGIQAVMNTPFHMDRVGLLYSRVFSELKGVTDAMDQQISRVLAQGMADGDSPRLLARKINAVISGKGIGDLGLTTDTGRFIPAKRRAEMIARTETIRSHHQATIQEYKNWRVEGIRVKAEWRTAGDERVCEECEMLEASEWTLEEIESVIPVHPNCRCIALPLEYGGKEESIKEESIKEESIKEESIFEKGWENKTDMREAKAQFKELNSTIVHVEIFKQIEQAALNRTNIIGKTLTEVLSAYPKLRKRAMAKTHHLKFSLWNKSPVHEGAVVPNAMADYSTYHKQIRIGQNALARTSDSLSVGKLRHNIGSDLASVVRHEYGHHVHLRLLSKPQKVKWDQFYAAKGQRYFEMNVSHYSGTDAMEAFAESFAAFTSPLYGVRGGRLPVEVEKLILSFIK